jgi:hypothetical protein
MLGEETQHTLPNIRNSSYVTTLTAGEACSLRILANLNRVVDVGKDPVLLVIARDI